MRTAMPARKSADGDCAQMLLGAPKHANTTKTIAPLIFLLMGRSEDANTWFAY